MSSSNKLKELLKELEIKIPKKLFQTALTHSSLTYETKNAEFEGVPNYERLEFLGDSVLKLLISDILYKKYPDYPEGRMTKIRSILVSDNTIFKLGVKFQLPDLILLSKSEEKDHGREKESVVACAFEAILGAIYLSCGIEKTMKFLKTIYKNLPKEVDENLENYNAKAVLQEYTQKMNKDLPQYEEISETGKANNKIFTFAVIYQNKTIAQGSGKTKREAQQNAAKSACIKLGLLKGTQDE